LEVVKAVHISLLTWIYGSQSRFNDFTIIQRSYR